MGVGRSGKILHSVATAVWSTNAALVKQETLPVLMALFNTLSLLLLLAVVLAVLAYQRIQ